jgi:ATP-dependent Lon protease
MNPVFYFDELDKVSETPKGDEIIGILTHLTDITQNSQFHDKYFSHIDFDLSKALFIFSYNDESKINPILKDRMYRIGVEGYTGKEKNVIAREFLLPKIRTCLVLDPSKVLVPDETLDYINSVYTEEEKGVRNLKRCLETVFTKINLLKLMRPGAELFDKEMNLDIEYPFTVTIEIVKKLVKNIKSTVPFGMYA